ncbi:MAG: PilN domain-containing protein [Deltaproteobacteria bacterium]|nr:PilN domain-containing protein [Deltaproteobacteria bacterium]
MIRINLLGEKKDTSGTYFIQIFAFISSIFVLLLTCFFLYQGTSEKVNVLETDKSMLEQQVKVLEKKTAEVKELEQKEKLLKDKLSAIAQLKAKKKGPVHTLDELTKSIPEKSWLENVKERDGLIELKGIALDNQTIAVFIRDLENSSYFQSVDLIQSKQYVKDDVKMKEFALALKSEDPLARHRLAATNKSEGPGSDDAQTKIK